MTFTADCIDPYEIAAENAHAEWLNDCAEEDPLAGDTRNHDTREWDGEEE